MRQICPNCKKPIEVPEASAGQEFTCTQCNTPFPVPAAYAPSVTATVPVPPADRPPPPPGLAVNPYLPYTPPAPPPVSSDPAAEREIHFKLSPLVLNWLPVGCLTLVFLLTFFSWNGLYPGDIRLYSQIPWQALFGSISDNAGLPAELLTDETELTSRMRANVLFLLPYLLLLLATIGFSWVERLLRDPDPLTIPGPLAWVLAVWPRRLGILAVLSIVMFVLLLLQSWRGFGLENAADLLAIDRTESILKDDAKYQAMPENSRKASHRSVVYGRELGKLSPDNTLFLKLALLAHFIAALSACIRVWMDRRGDNPVPSLIFRF